MAEQEGTLFGAVQHDPSAEGALLAAEKPDPSVGHDSGVYNVDAPIDEGSCDGSCDGYDEDDDYGFVSSTLAENNSANDMHERLQSYCLLEKVEWVKAQLNIPEETHMMHAVRLANVLMDLPCRSTGNMVTLPAMVKALLIKLLGGEF